MPTITNAALTALGNKVATLYIPYDIAEGYVHMDPVDAFVLIISLYRRAISLTEPVVLEAIDRIDFVREPRMKEYAEAFQRGILQYLEDPANVPDDAPHVANQERLKVDHLMALRRANPNLARDSRRRLSEIKAQRSRYVAPLDLVAGFESYAVPAGFQDRVGTSPVRARTPTSPPREDTASPLSRLRNGADRAPPPTSPPRADSVSKRVGASPSARGAARGASPARSSAGPARSSAGPASAGPARARPQSPRPQSPRPQSPMPSMRERFAAWKDIEESKWKNYKPGKQ